MSPSLIYLDNNATTALDPVVKEAMVEELNQVPSNPSSVHSYGRLAKQRLLRARDNVARYFQVKPEELIFTSSGTEALHHLIYSVCQKSPKGHIISSNMEHSAVYSTLNALIDQGYRITFLEGNERGCIDPRNVEEAIESDTCLIILMSVNNETGVKTPIVDISEIALKHKIPFVVDAISQLGKENFEIPKGVTGMAFSAHKLHGPKGVGLAYLKKPLSFLPIFRGGHQEFDARAGTENLSGIIGFSKAIEILKTVLPKATLQMQSLRDHFEESLLRQLDCVTINGKGNRICNVCNMTFSEIDGETLLILLDQKGVMASMGSACSSGAIEPSRVLINMGLTPKKAKSTLRFSLSRFTTKNEIDRAVNIIVQLVHELS